MVLLVEHQSKFLMISIKIFHFTNLIGLTNFQIFPFKLFEGKKMSENEIEAIETDTEIDEEQSILDKKGLSKDKMESKRKLEEYLENKKLEDELNHY